MIVDCEIGKKVIKELGGLRAITLEDLPKQDDHSLPSDLFNIDSDSDNLKYPTEDNSIDNKLPNKHN